MKPRQPGADRAHPNGSTGPRSAAGKARSSMNALKSGIYSKSLIIPGENPAHLDTLLDEYFQRYHPTVPEQRDLVDILVRSTWTLRRLSVAEAQIFAHEMDRANKLDTDSPIGHAFCLSDRTLSRLQRMVNSTQRNFRDALRQLERIASEASGSTSQPTEAEPVNPSRQFVSSSSATPPPAAQKAAQKPLKKPLPYHRPGVTCYFEPVDPTIYERCPLCFPREESSNDLENDSSTQKL
jgi:hypothetical protein